MNPISPNSTPPFWAALDLQLPDELVAVAVDLERVLNRSALPLAMIILAADKTGRSNHADARDLEDWLLQHIARDGANKRIIIRWLRIVYAAIVRLNRAGASLVPNRLAIDVEPPKSPFQPEQTTLAARALVWEAALHHWIRVNLPIEPGRSVDLAEHRAAIVLSAALGGALLDAKALWQLAQQAGERIPLARDLASIDFKTVHAGIKTTVLRRWFPDPITEGVWAQWCPTEGSSEPKMPVLLAGMQRVIGVDHSPPRSLAALARGAAALWCQRASLADVGIAKGAIVAQSIKPDVWFRLQQVVPETKKSTSTESSEVAAPVESRRVASIRSGGDDSGEVDDDLGPEYVSLAVPWLAGFLDLMAPATVKGSANRSRKTFIDAAEAWRFDDKDRWAEPYRTWLIAMLSQTNTAGDRLALSTIGSYVRMLLPRLIGMVGLQNPASLEPGELGVWYGDILESMPSGGSRKALAAAIREFHAHLLKTYGAKSIALSDVLGKDGELAVVDARIVTPDEMSRAREWLRSRIFKGEHPDLMQVMSLLLMLAFRCGLRRMELLLLRICDLQVTAGGDLRIVPHAERGLKSKSSERNLPLRTLLPKTEWEELLAWWSRRKQRETAAGGRVHDERYLFAIPALGFDRPPIENTIRWLHAALRDVTGDHELHLHHLRHSFATWTYLRLRIGLYPGLVERFRHWPETFAMLNNGSEFARQLIPGGQTGSRSAAYAVARLLGHSGGNISYEHYIHSSEWVWLGLTYRHAARLPRPLLIAAAGLRRMTGYRRIDKSIETLVDSLRRKWKTRYCRLEARPPQSIAECVPSLEESSELLEFATALRRLRRILKDHDAGLAPATIAKQLKLGTTDVTWAIERATVLAGRIQWMGRVTKRATPHLCPPVWKGASAKSFAFGLQAALLRLVQTDPDLVDFGLRCALFRFNPERKDVVFKSFDDAPVLSRFLSFLESLGPGVCRPIVVLRDVEDMERLLSQDSMFDHPYFKWKNLVTLPESIPVSRHSPNKEKTSYRRWLGIHVMPPTGGEHHMLMIGTLMLVLMEIERRNRVPDEND